MKLQGTLTHRARVHSVFPSGDCLRGSGWNRSWLVVALFAVLAGGQMSAQAEDSGIYFGVGLGAMDVDFDFDNGFLYGESADLQATNISAHYTRSARASSLDQDFSFRVLTGTRWDLSHQVFAATEVTAVWYSDDLPGYWAGTFARSREPHGWRRDLDVWPDKWELEREYEYGLNLKLEHRLQGLEFLGSQRSVYASAGVSRLKLDAKSFFTSESNGNANLAQGANSSSDKLTAWTIGAGIKFGEAGRHFAVEVFRTEYDIDFRSNGDDLTSDTSMLYDDYDVEEWGLSLSYIWGW